MCFCFFLPCLLCCSFQSNSSAHHQLQQWRKGNSRPSWFRPRC
uniref:Uncharacterized protein n=1 Tax=Anguilla anguilla TaxID=7936 RepID=A0A0E9XI47_ANGAN